MSSKTPNKPAKKPVGKPLHKPTSKTRNQVSLHARVGTTHKTIGELIGIDPKTLRKHYRKELDFAKVEAVATVGGALFNKATEGDTTAMIFWMKTQAGWREVKEETEDKDVKPLNINFTVSEAVDEIKVTKGK